MFQYIKNKFKKKSVQSNSEQIFISSDSHNNKNYVEFINDKGKSVMQFTIPTTGLSPEEAEKSIKELISDYKEETVYFNDDGTLHINGQKEIPYNKVIFMPTENK